MIQSSRLRLRLYAFAFVDEAGPLITLFTLWFNDNGITTDQVSTVFMLWAAASIALEVPSGALADRVDRRVVVAASMVLRGLGISLWLVWPTFSGVVIGAMLWGMHGALASGAWEALIYEQLDAQGEAQQYPVVMARVGQFSHGGVAVGTLGATALMHAGAELAILGWVTVGLHVLALALIAGLPQKAVAPPEAVVHSYGDWWATLRGGVRAVGATPGLLLIVGIAALLEGLFIYDDYVPLLARFRGAGDDTVPLLVLSVWCGLLLGGELAARRPNLGWGKVALLLLAGSVALGVSLISSALWTVGLIGVTYGAMNVAWITSEARLQSLTADATRATVRSVVAFFGGLVNMAFFGVVALVSPGDNPAPGMLASAPVLLLVAALMLRGSRRPAPPNQG